MLLFCRMICNSCRFVLSCCALISSYCMSNILQIFLPSGRGRSEGNPTTYIVGSLLTKGVFAQGSWIKGLSFNVSEPLSLEGSHTVLSEGLCQVLLAQLVLSSSDRPIPAGWTGMIQQPLLCCPVQPSAGPRFMRGDIQSMER